MKWEVYRRGSPGRRGNRSASPTEPTCRCEGCTNIVPAAYVQRYNSCCSPACSDAWEDAQEIAALKARIAELEADMKLLEVRVRVEDGLRRRAEDQRDEGRAEVERLREELRVMAARLREVRDTALLRQGQIDQLRKGLDTAREYKRQAATLIKELEGEQDRLTRERDEAVAEVERLVTRMTLAAVALDSEVEAAGGEVSRHVHDALSALSNEGEALLDKEER